MRWMDSRSRHAHQRPSASDDFFAWVLSLPWVVERRATSNDRRRKYASASSWLSSVSSAILTRHVAAGLGKVGLTGAGLLDEFAVEHHDQTVRKSEQFVKVFADEKHRGPRLRAAMIPAWIQIYTL